MAKRTADTSTADTTPEDTTNPETTAAAVTDDQGQVTPDSPQATGVVRTVNTSATRSGTYGAGTGYEAGNTAPESLYLDLETNKVVSTQPERSQTLTVKGSPVEPWAARTLTAYDQG